MECELMNGIEDQIRNYTFSIVKAVQTIEEDFVNGNLIDVRDMLKNFDSELWEMAF
jgi:hypothetical protein